jgi:hypothetical protein
MVAHRRFGRYGQQRSGSGDTGVSKSGGAANPPPASSGGGGAFGFFGFGLPVSRR